jgi:hypothetical protein
MGGLSGYLVFGIDQTSIEYVYKISSFLPLVAYLLIFTQCKMKNTDTSFVSLCIYASSSLFFD